MTRVLIVANLFLACHRSNGQPAQAARSAPVPMKPPTAQPHPPNGGLSLFESIEGHCHWQHVDIPAGTRQDIFMFPTPCETSPVIRFTRRADEAFIQRAGPLMLVSLDTGTVTILPDPPAGEAKEIGFDAKGHPVVLTEAHNPKFPDSEAQVVLRAYTLGLDNAWKQTEYLENQETDLDHVAGVSVLKTADAIGVHNEGRVETPSVEDKRLEKKLDAVWPDFFASLDKDDRCAWKPLPTTPPSYVYSKLEPWCVTTGAIVFDIHGHLTAAADMPKRLLDGAYVHVRGAHVLVTEGAQLGPARLYDAATGKLLFRTDAEVAAVFWPELP